MVVGARNVKSQVLMPPPKKCEKSVYSYSKKKLSKIKWRSSYCRSSGVTLGNLLYFTCYPFNLSIVTWHFVLVCLNLYDCITLCVCVCVLLSKPNSECLTSAEAHKCWQWAKLMVPLTLFSIHTHVFCQVCFIFLIQFSTASDSELEGNYREKWTNMIIGWKSPRSV